MSAHPQLSLCMIVRDSAATLPACLASIRPWVDEIVVVDTGSQDFTRRIAQDFGARLFEFPWCDDFSAARNQSLAHATGDWLFWMDSDDTIDAVNGAKLQALARGEHPPHILAYVMQVVCPGREGWGADESTVVDHVKLIRRHPALRFEFRIHEQLLPSIRRLGGEVGWTDIFVTHSGSDPSLAARQRKYERDLRILGKELADRPDHPFALFNFGMTYSDMEDHARAAEYLERCLAVSTPQETQVRKAYALLVHSYEQLGRAAEAADTCQRALGLYPDDPELLFRRGKLLHEAKRHEEACECYQRVLHGPKERQFTSIDRGVMGYKARHNLALVYQDMQRHDDAELQWRRVLESDPGFRPAWRLLGQSLVEQRKLVTAELHLESMRQREGLQVESLLVEADLALARNKADAARAALEQAAAIERSTEALEALCKLEFERGTATAAIEQLERLRGKRGNDAATLHNLGAMYLQSGDAATAHQYLEQSLAIRTDFAPTRELLALAAATRASTEQESRIAAASTSKPIAPLEPQPAKCLARTLDVALVTVGYNLPGATERLLHSALLGCRHRLTFFVVSHAQLPEKRTELERIAERRDVIYRDYGFNRGLAKSWNEGILWGHDHHHDVVLVVNEDVVFEAGDITCLADYAAERRDRFLVTGRCRHENNSGWTTSEYGCFAVNRLALETVGCFDENFFPVYCEDSDYRRRASLLGLETGHCDSTGMRHIGSASQRQPEVARQNELTYAANRAYYARKWGGDGGQEQFQRPFNDRRFTNYIDPRVREAPYPGFDRTDHAIVQI